MTRTLQPGLNLAERWSGQTYFVILRESMGIDSYMSELFKLYVEVQGPSINALKPPQD